jgi:hypothetical protein
MFVTDNLLVAQQLLLTDYDCWKGSKLNSKVTSKRLMRLIWDPGSLDDSGLGASRILRGGKCQVLGSVGCDTAQRCGLMSQPRPIYQKGQTTSNRRESFRRIEQEQLFIVYLPTSVQVSQPSAVVASLPLIPAILCLNSL